MVGTVVERHILRARMTGSKRGKALERMLECRPVDSLRLRFPDRSYADLLLGPGVHGIGRVPGGGIGPVADAQDALVQVCVDRRGAWMRTGAGSRGVHVNGRPVRRMAMLRVGDAIYIDGAELLLLGIDSPSIDALPPPANDAGDPRFLLRGVGGQHHGRSFTLERARLVGRGADCDIRIDDPAFPDRHARIEVHGDAVLLRDLGAGEGSVVNGEAVRNAVLHPGDQLVFDAHHRFVVEAPGRPGSREAAADALDESPAVPATQPVPSRNTRRLPWLLLAALLLAAALSALLLFGASG
jgi:pSer/pThr/pTyr-binding forkhead associated (FHA) protein